jgi:hypothetical protein
LFSKKIEILLGLFWLLVGFRKELYFRETGATVLGLVSVFTAQPEGSIRSIRYDEAGGTVNDVGATAK